MLSICRKPFSKGNMSFGCGQCLPCRVNKSRLWQHRLMLESYDHDRSTFVTLTYAPENIPLGGTLNPEDTKNFLKRLREDIYPKKIRYYLVGEYGDETFRPHYHLALYGLGPEHADLIGAAWGMGHVYCGDLTPESAGYVCGYVVKKMTKKDDPRLGGRHPEFARMSLRPGIGGSKRIMEAVANTLTTDSGSDEIIALQDVPSQLMHGKKKYPLGRYLKERLRLQLGHEKKTHPDTLLALSLRAVDKHNQLVQESKKCKKNFYRYAREKRDQQILNIETRFRLRKQKKL